MEPVTVIQWLNWSLVWDTGKFFILVLLILLRKIFSFFCTPIAKSLKGEVILVTGSANGLGKEMCRELITSGAILVLWDVQSQENARVAQELRDLGVKRVISQTVDVSDREKVKEAAMKLRHEVGPVTVLINNAGIAPMQPFFEMRAETIQKTFGVNVLSQFWTFQEFLPDMIRMNKGHIVTICSIMGIDPMRGCPPYCSSKHATHGLVECMKDELAHLGNCDNIKFTTVYPFFIKTKLVDERHAGLKLEFKNPTLTPFLEVEYVAKRVVEAIVHEEEHLYLPSHFDYYIRFIVPFMSSEVRKVWVNYCLKEYKYTKPELVDKKISAMDKLDLEIDKEVTSKSF